MDYYIKPDILEGDNKYHCEKYNTKIKAQKRSFLNKTSNTLIINLKRFEFDYNTFRKYKVNDYCEFPMELNIKQWTKEGIEQREGKEEEKKQEDEGEGEEFVKKNIEEMKEDEEGDEDDKDEAYIYEAVGVIVHSGGAEGGHYYSYIKERDRNKWYEFNDTNVKPFDLKNLAEETFGGDGKDGNNDDFNGIYSRCRNAYLIIYQRKNPVPYETIQLNNPDHEYVKGIPKSIYQHIWDENMLFMKRMYFFDSEYVNFVREFLSLNHYERNLYTNTSPLTKRMNSQREVAQILNITDDDFKVQIEMEDIEMFDDSKQEPDEEEKIEEKESKDKEEKKDENDSETIIVNPNKVEPEDLQKAKDLAINSYLSESNDNK